VRDEMQKQEIIQFHTLFAQIKEELERLFPDEEMFKEYMAFGVFPQHVHKSKKEHEKAVFILGEEIARAFSSHKYGIGRVAEKLFEMQRRIS